MPKDSKPPAFLFYVDDFASDGKVEAMTTEEVGAYILLLCKAWREDPVGSLPADDRVLARWARLTPDRWSECKLSVLSTFDLRTDGRLYQKRMEREFRKMKETKKKRERAATQAANARWGDAKRMRNASKSHSKRNADLCLSSSTSSSPSISEKPKDTFLSEGCSEAAKSPPSEPPVLTFQCVKGESWGLPQKQVDAWSVAYPAVDVLSECRKAHAWIEANSAKRKTRGGMPAFLNRWLANEQNRGGTFPSRIPATGPPSHDGDRQGEIERRRAAQRERLGLAGGGCDDRS